MSNFKKILKKNTIFIKNGDHLEKIRDSMNGVLFGYDDTFEDEDVVNSGYLHYEDKMFFLSKNNLNKNIIESLWDVH